VPLVDGPLPGGADVVGGGEIGLADAERDDVLALGLELSDLSEDHEGILGTQLTRAS